MRFFWLRERVEAGDIAVFHIGTDFMPADALTKPLGRNKMDVARRMLGLADSFDVFAL